MVDKPAGDVRLPACARGDGLHGFIGKFGVAFTPEAVKVLTAAFDDAWAAHSPRLAVSMIFLAK